MMLILGTFSPYSTPNSGSNFRVTSCLLLYRFVLFLNNSTRFQKHWANVPGGASSWRIWQTPEIQEGQRQGLLCAVVLAALQWKVDSKRLLKIWQDVSFPRSVHLNVLFPAAFWCRNDGGHHWAPRCWFGGLFGRKALAALVQRRMSWKSKHWQLIWTILVQVSFNEKVLLSSKVKAKPVSVRRLRSWWKSFLGDHLQNSSTNKAVICPVTV